MRWTLQKSENVIHNQWIVVRRDEVLTSSGYEIEDYYVVEQPDFVNIIAITDDGKFLIEEQYRHAIERVCYELPAGKIECGETPLQAAQRELLEETGFGGGEWVEYYKSSSNSSVLTSECITFLAKGVTKVQKENLEKSEDIVLHVLKPEIVQSLLSSQFIYEGVHQAPLWKYFFDNKI